MENFEKQPEQIDWEQLEAKRTLIYRDPDKYKKLFEFTKKLEAKYSGCHDYKFYHFLISSGPPHGHEFPKMDFPDEDSVENFINSSLA